MDKSENLIDSSFLGNERIDVSEGNRPIGLFSNREWEIYHLMVNGHTNREIGQTLNLAEKTVKNYISTIFEKVKISNRTSAILIALKKGWFVL